MLLEFLKCHKINIWFGILGLAALAQQKLHGFKKKVNSCREITSVTQFLLKPDAVRFSEPGGLAVIRWS